MTRVLIAAPVHDAKEYCFRAYIDQLAKITWVDRSIFLVDTSRSDTFYHRWHAECLRRFITLYRMPVIHNETPQERVARALNIIRHKAITENFKWLSIVEQDNFIPLNYLERLTAYSDVHQPMVIVTPYWGSGEREGDKYGFPRLLALDGVAYDKGNQIFDRIMLPNESFGFMDGAVKPVYGGSFGACLIRSEAMAAIPFQGGSHAYPDQYFFARCKEQGIPVMMDTGLVSLHLNEDFLFEYHQRQLE